MVFPPYSHRRTRSMGQYPDGQFVPPGALANTTQPYPSPYQPAPPNPYTAPANYATPPHPPLNNIPAPVNYTPAPNYVGTPPYRAPLEYSPPSGYIPSGGYTQSSNGRHAIPFPTDSPYSGYSTPEWDQRVRWDQSEQARPSLRLTGMYQSYLREPSFSQPHRRRF